MSLAAFRNIGAYIKTLINVQAIAETAEVDGSAVQISGPGVNYQSCQLVLALGAATGSPSAVSVTATVQDSADGSAGWAAIGSSVNSVTVAAASTQASANIDLRAARNYIRVATVPTLTGGTSPTVAVVAALALGGTDELPAA